MKILNFLLIIFLLHACKKDDTEPESILTKPLLTTISVTNISETTAVSGGSITDDGGKTVIARGVCYSTAHNPTTNDFITNNGVGSGNFSSNLTGLTPNTTYYIRAYATNAIGTAYGNELHFTTLLPNTVPSVITKPIINIYGTSATGGGNIINDGGSAVTRRGICYSTNPNPTTANFITIDGTGTGNYNSSLTALTANTIYYVRAYATNANGTAYGDEEVFTTQNGMGGNFPGTTVLVNGGTFLMGSPYGIGYVEEHPQHSVTVNSFRISKYEITNQQFAAFMNGISADSDGSYNGTEYLNVSNNYCEIEYVNGQFVAKAGKENHPVVYVSWYGAKAFAGYYGGRLPTEAEWEFAARGGNNSNGYVYSGSNNLDEVAWYLDNSGHESHIVGTKNPNELEIYDMTGNAEEWCNDWANAYYYINSPSDNPQGPPTGLHRAVRGNSFASSANYCRVTVRNGRLPHNTFRFLGFRPVFAP